MKFFRFGPPGRERPGVVDGQGIGRDISSIIPDLSGAVLAPERLAAVKTLYESEDAREGARAFAEKRKPRWKGQ